MSKALNDNLVDFLHHFSKVNTAMKGFMRNKFKEHGVNITFEMLQVLRFLWNKDGVNQQEIADATLKDKASLTYLIDNLVRRQLVQRTEDQQDRRNKIITLTPQGHQLKARITPWIEEMFQVASRDVPPGLFDSGLELFEAIYQNFQKGKD
jgi:DNA-binding MarR family transcriptional regulator